MGGAASGYRTKDASVGPLARRLWDTPYSVHDTLGQTDRENRDADDPKAMR